VVEWDSIRPSSVSWELVAGQFLKNFAVWPFGGTHFKIFAVRQKRHHFATQFKASLRLNFENFSLHTTTRYFRFTRNSIPNLSYPEELTVQQQSLKITNHTSLPFNLEWTCEKQLLLVCVGGGGWRWCVVCAVCACVCVCVEGCVCVRGCGVCVCVVCVSGWAWVCGVWVASFWPVPHFLSFEPPMISNEVQRN
jgi:hypothetical protein